MKTKKTNAKKAANNSAKKESRNLAQACNISKGTATGDTRFFTSWR